MKLFVWDDNALGIGQYGNGLMVVVAESLDNAIAAIKNHMGDEFSWIFNNPLDQTPEEYLRNGAVVYDVDEPNVFEATYEE